MRKITSFKLLFRAILLLFFVALSFKSFGAPKQEYYEIRIYHLFFGQEGKVDAFLKDVYLPALHRAGIPKVGVFKPVGTDTESGKLIFVFVPFKTAEQYVMLPEILEKDKVYQEAGKSFLDAPFNDPPYKRHESILLKAFLYMPQPYFPEYTNPAS